MFQLSRRIVWIALVVACGSSKPAPSTTPTASVPVTHETVSEPTPATPTAPSGEPVVPGSGNRCDMLPTGDLSIDGMLDDWKDKHLLARAGSPADGAMDVRCVWDGKAIAFAIDVKDDRLIRVKGGQEDHVTLALAAGGRPAPRYR